MEDLADLVSHCVIDSLDVEFGGKGSLYAVDDGKFRVAFLGDF
jgi:hypothetical protein